LGVPYGLADGDGTFMFALFKDKIFYGWVVTAAGFLIAFFGLGTRLSFGVFVKSIEGVFGLSRVTTSGIFSVYMLLCCVFAVLGGWALDKYGPKRVAFLMGSFTGLSLLLTSQANAAWQLFITYGLLLSLGTGPVFTVVNSTASRWFDKKRGFVLGITSSGGGLGAIVLAPLATYLISNFDWRTAFLVVGIIAWPLMGFMALLLIKDPRDIGLMPDGIESAKTRTSPNCKDHAADSSARQSLQKSQFWFLAFVWLFLSLSIHLIYVHAVPFAVDNGVESMDAAIILSLIGIATLAGRVVVGKLSDMIGRKTPAIVCGLLQAGSLLWLIWARDLWIFYSFAIGFGIFSGGLGGIVTVLIGDVFGMGSIGTIMGMLSVGWALGAASGPVIGGYVFDLSGNYSIAFAAAAAAVLLATFFVALIRRERD